MWTKQNYYSHTEQLLFGTLHSTRVLYTFFKTIYYLIIKLLFWKQKRTIGSYTNKKVFLSRDGPCLYPAFLFFNEFFFLKLTRTVSHAFSYRNYSTVVFAFWLGLVLLRVWNGCVYNLWNVTQESYSVRVQVLGSHCALRKPP